MTNLNNKNTKLSYLRNTRHYFKECGWSEDCQDMSLKTAFFFEPTWRKSLENAPAPTEELSSAQNKKAVQEHKWQTIFNLMQNVLSKKQSVTGKPKKGYCSVLVHWPDRHLGNVPSLAQSATSTMLFIALENAHSYGLALFKILLNDLVKKKRWPQIAR